MSNSFSTYLEVNLKSLEHNYRFMRRQLKSNTKLLAVVKAFAYGHEAVAIAQTLEKEKVDYLAVAYVREGVNLRKAGIKTPILVLHPLRDEAAICKDYQLEPNIYSFGILDNYLKSLTSDHPNTPCPIHLKFNTGLNRLGFKPTDIEPLTDIIKANTSIKVQSVFSHLIASEDLSLKALTRQQIVTYFDIVNKVEKALGYSFIKHLTNTSGTLNYPEAHFDMVRSGIGLYGYGNDDRWTQHLKPVGKLYSTITQIHEVKPGDSVGYNQGYIAEQLTRSATIPLGHADGIPRAWGKGKGYVTINGQQAPVLGNVCMDMIMVDVTHIKCGEGDQVVVFDCQKTVEDIATNVGTITYELLTNISQRVPRVVISK